MAQAKLIKAKTVKREEILGTVLKDGTIIETIYSPDAKPHCVFVVAGLDQKPQVMDRYTVCGDEVFPPERQVKAFHEGMVVLPSTVVEVDDTSILLMDLKRLLGKYIDVEPFYLNLIAHYILMSWVYDAFGSFGYLRLKGDAGCGKTRVLDVTRWLVYRGTHLGVRPTTSAMFRLAHEIRGTLILDEVDRTDSDLYSGFVQIVNAGYRIDGRVTLSEPKDDVWSPRWFNIGSPKILSTRLSFGDPALESRCLTIPMAVKTIANHIYPFLPRRFYEEALSMQNRMLAWRIANRHKIDLDDSALRHLEPRAREIGLSLYAVSPDEEFRKQLIHYLEVRSSEFVFENPLAVVIEAILRVTQNDPRTKVYMKELRMVAQELAVERDMPMQDFTEKKIAEMCRNLRFKVGRDGRRGTYAVLRSIILKEHKDRFGLNDAQTGGGGGRDEAAQQ